MGPVRGGFEVVYDMEIHRLMDHVERQMEGAGEGSAKGTGEGCIESSIAERGHRDLAHLPRAHEGTSDATRWWFEGEVGWRPAACRRSL
jgi:hypothetical protein